MRIGLAGLLLTAIGASLIALGCVFDFSLLLMIPGGLLALVGTSLLSAAREQVLSETRHSISDSYDHGGGDTGPSQLKSGENSSGK
jgi:hypothetical protein